MTTEMANALCLVIATSTIAAVFHDNISYIAHHRSSEAIRVSHPVDKHVSRIQGSVEAGSPASIHQQPSCPVLPSGCPLKP